MSSGAEKQRIIGIVGGVGPHAGADLLCKVFDQTSAETDQEHLPVAMLSYPGQVADRTAFLLGSSKVNPAHALHKMIIDLAGLGATVIGIPCNSAHAPPILGRIESLVQASGLQIDLLNMIQETVDFISAELTGVTRVGILATAGSVKTGAYAAAMHQTGLKPVLPDAAGQQRIHDTIYSIKCQPNPPLERDRRCALEAIAQLADAGAEAVVLGCTELPLVVPEEQMSGARLVDPTLILARALIRHVDPQKLKPWTLGQMTAN